ncbi:Peptide methionine sulfoxide reductase [Klebsormidium nitens]|uniref:peptide-methionine (S)-S-oxide reductase n=1 Tax=Klebsormidium nitens TaxID=105231 RepID=A0A0U9HI97_KLENI|nr:Peptide methionine sulfoxide reductase [Klebsormidium nitens]|eukprot:GAQ77993.1 Peptide methionine sulfoxide reductase [Klebsormidium nitens]
MAAPNDHAVETACFAAGCFWGVETTLACVPGVITTAVGYTGGHVENPTYKQVCYKDTGHAEAVLLTFDPSKVSFKQLLEVFFENHNPTTLNRQGPDYGSQYRSAVFYYSEEQKEATLAAKKKYEALLNKPVVTQIVPAVTFYNAEDYHQKYALRLRDHKPLLTSLKMSDKEILTSPIAAKLNGYVTGQAPPEVLQEVEALPLRDETRRLLPQIHFAGPACHYKAFNH